MKKRLFIYFIISILIFIKEDFARQKSWYVKSIEFQGNETFSRRALLGMMDLKPSVLFAKSRFSEWRLHSDIEVISRFYKSQGFLDNKITNISVDRDTSKGRVFLQLSIVEGPRTAISSVRITPENNVLDSAIIPKLHTKYGDFLSSSSIQKDIELLKDTLAMKGYLDASVKSVVEFDTAHYMASVVYHITQGSRIKVGEIRLEGLKKLRPTFVLRELDFRKGDILTSYRVHKSEENLFRTNLLNAVQVEHVNQPSELSVQIDSVDAKCPVIVHVQESDFFKIKAGIGYSYLSGYKIYEGTRANLETSYSNFFALGHQMTFRTDLTFPEQNTELNYSTPWFFGIPLQFGSKLYLDRFQKRNYDSAVVLGEELSFSYQANRHLEYNMRFNWENMFNYKGMDSTSNQPRKLTQTVGFDITFDNRNDIVDPLSALYNVLSFNIAGLADTNSNRYLKITDDFRFYWKTGWLSWATGLNVGWIYTYDKKRSDVPPLEQFSLGGTNVLRCFDQRNELHLEQGGLKLAANLIEVRFPIYWWFNGAFFVDCGKLYESSEIFKKDLIWCAGPGLRIKTPLAIIRMDVGFNLDRHTKSSPYAFQFDVGQPF